MADSLKLLRVVRCLPSCAGLPGCGRTQRAKPEQLEEETAGYTEAGQDRRCAMGI